MSDRPQDVRPQDTQRTFGPNALPAGARYERRPLCTHAPRPYTQTARHRSSCERELLILYGLIAGISLIAFVGILVCL
jgi:hypothetical protein